MSKRVLLYSRFNRIWHWSQVLMILVLILTGFEVHGTLKILGYESAILVHNVFAVMFIILYVLIFFWHLVTGNWKHYSLTNLKVVEQLRYYACGIFAKEGCPFKKTEAVRLNPMQKLSYLFLWCILIPGQVLSGAVYYFYDSWQGVDKWLHLDVSEWSLRFIALSHTGMAFFFAAFIIAHIYMITTADGVIKSLKEMVTGYQDLK